ncbi:hypothetical protein J6590_013840 [Homalodisca vitripennis]|nr:hypothetical protein J6590_013840 [Homalodisca vitripennis]
MRGDVGLACSGHEKFGRCRACKDTAHNLDLCKAAGTHTLTGSSFIEEEGRFILGGQKTVLALSLRGAHPGRQVKLTRATDLKRVTDVFVKKAFSANDLRRRKVKKV